MGNDVSHILLLELAESVRSIKQRLGILETDVAALHKSVVKSSVGHSEHGKIISKIEDHIFNMKLLEEGRPLSVRHHNKPSKFHTQSLVLK